MKDAIYSMFGILIPFIGTSLGSGFVFFLKKNINKKIKKMIIGFAVGVMIAASIWSLIMPSIQMAEKQKIIKWIPATIGLIVGVLTLILVNEITENIQKRKNNKKINMLVLSITLHNIPEGMAVGVCFAGFLAKNTGIGIIEALLLAIGIALQNIPEGAIISMPLKIQGKSKTSSFMYGVLSGLVEPIAAIITVLLINIIIPTLPYLLAFAAGTMIYVVVEELIPEMQEGRKSPIGMIGVCLGFILMMILDVIFS